MQEALLRNSIVCLNMQKRSISVERLEIFYRLLNLNYQNMGVIKMSNKEQFILLDETYLPQMAELFKKAFGREPWNDDWSDEKQLKEYIKEISHSYNALNYGLLINGELAALSIGMIRHWWEGTNYNIEEFCVSPDIQGQGIGSRFMNLIEADIQNRGLCGIFLQTDSDKPAFNFYCKNGFIELESHVSFYKRVKK